MPSFNTITKLSNLKGGLGKGSTRDKLRNLGGKLNSSASIIDDFLEAPPGEGTAFSKSSLLDPSSVSFGDGYIKFPDALGSTEYPSWVEITIYRRESLSYASVEKAAKDSSNATKEKHKTEPNVLGEGGNILEQGASAAIGAVGKAVTFKKSKDRVNGTVSNPFITICLPIQAGMGADDRAVSIGAEQLGSIGGAVLEQGVSGALSNLFSTKFLKGLGTATAFKTPGIGTALKVMTGSILNPYSYQLFNGVEHRAFNLTFNIAPLSGQEAEQFKAILEILQYHQQPENEGFLLSVPDEFKIRYMQLEPQQNKDKTTHVAVENKFYPKTMGCYLQSVGYIPNDQGDSIHKDGAPITSQLTLQFSEIEVLDKARLRDSNYYYKGTNTISTENGIKK